jgi:dolichyl-phosphate beta-glucosyltransferase
MNNRPFLSVIIPVYNESKRLYNLSEIVKFFNGQHFPWELIIVNDGSRDATLKQLRLLNKKYKFKIITYLPNQGKGFAIKSGMLQATGKYRLFMDIDLSTPLEEFHKFKPFFEKFPVVIATRKTKGSKLIIHQSFIRETLGKGFTLLSKIILNLNVSDFTCGFKCFSEDAAVKIFSNLTINRWGFDSEVLFLTKKFKFGLREITVTWKNDPQTRVKFPQDIINSLVDLWRIRVNSFQGRYIREKSLALSSQNRALLNLEKLK